MRGLPGEHACESEALGAVPKEKLRQAKAARSCAVTHTSSLGRGTADQKRSRR